MRERPDGEDLEIRTAEPRDARAFLEHWTAIVAEERFVRSEEVQTSARAYRRRFRQRSDLGTDLHAPSKGDAWSATSRCSASGIP